MSQFDTLLDFESSGNGTTQTSNDLDPFGSSPSVEVKGGSDFDLLGELGFTQSSANGNSVNPLYELSMDQGTSDNLIMTEEIQVTQKSTKSANPLYDLENDTSEPSVNPLYNLNENSTETNGHTDDLLGLSQNTEVGVTNGNGHEVDLLGTGTTDDSGVTMETETSNEGENLLASGGSQELQFEVRQDESRESMNGISDEDSELVEKLNEAESQEILQNQNREQEVSPEQTEITFDNQSSEIIVDSGRDQDQIVQITEEVIENVDQTEPDVSQEDQVEQQTIETDVITQEVIRGIQTEPEVTMETGDEGVDVSIKESDTTEQEVVEESVTTEQEVVEDNVINEQELIPTEEFRSRSSSSSSEEQKETAPEEQTESVIETTAVTSGDGVVVENGLDNEVYRETQEKEEVSFDQMSNIKNKLESNKAEDEDVIYRERKKSVHEEIADAEGGEYENEPVRNPDVVRESDKDIGAELPEVGTAKNILEKFKQIETTPKMFKREITPPEVRATGKVEYVSEPKPGIEIEAQKIEGGVFENQPVQEEDVVHSYDTVEEALPEKGYAKNILEKFKQIGTTSGESTPQRRELTPDRNTKYEYVSEPRAVLEKYEGKVESGVFESQPAGDLPDIIRSGMSNEEVLPEKGTARNLVSRYKEISDQAASPKASERKRELTPDKTGKVEYVSEPRSVLPKYEGKSEVGVFESRPEDKEEIVKSDMQLEDILPERGSAKNIAAKFREIESSKSPSPSSPKPRFKEVTPPRTDIAGTTVVGVLESTPAERGDIVKASEGIELKEEEMPVRGMAKDIANKFKQYQQSAPASSRGKKEFTPPPEGGVFENTPKPSLQVEVRQAESGVLESTPLKRDDVAREENYSAGDVEFPEEGYAKNMVSKWKQMESKSGNSTPERKQRDFTPPRDYPMSPKSPAGVDSSVKPSDLPGQYQEQKGYGGVYENKPQHLVGVVREGDGDIAEELPEKDAAKSMVQKFKAIQEQAKKAEEAPKPKSRKDSQDSNDSPVHSSKKMFEGSTDSPKGSFVPVQLDKCAACQKTVYAMEKMEMNKNIYHRACFKCSHCKCVLTPKTFSMNEGVIFCTNHFKQLFARKGNYDEGFGRQQYKKKWGTADSANEEQ